jgi:hypothetical protein
MSAWPTTLQSLKRSEVIRHLSFRTQVRMKPCASLCVMSAAGALRQPLAFWPHHQCVKS